MPKLFFSFVVILLVSCQQKHDKIYRSFYYWKTTMNFSAAENKKLQEWNIQKMYTRFFDVDFINQPITAGIIDIQQLPQHVSIIPVVYLTNKTLLNIKEVDGLADNISLLIKKILSANRIHTEEIQIDCDWSLQTKDTYFLLLKKIKSNFPEQTLSCTIRLHQVKYASTTGIPPVQRGMLMFYNMGDIKSKYANSIYNEKDANRYVRFVENYPLPLDVALPLFSWIKQFRFGKINALISNVSREEIKNNQHFTEKESHRFTVVENVMLHGNFFQKNDVLVLEELQPDITFNAARLVNRYIQTDTCSVILYHWNQQKIQEYDNRSIEKIYKVFQ